MSLGCAARWLDTVIYGKTIPTRALTSSIPSHNSHFFFVMRIFTIQSLASFKYTYNEVLQQSLSPGNWYLWRRKWQPTPVLLPGKSHGCRSLVGCSPWGSEESDTTECLPFHFSLSCFGEGNGNPLHFSCLENPRDGGAWWAAIYGVTQSRTWLKWLSSSSSSNWCLKMW